MTALPSFGQRLIGLDDGVLVFLVRLVLLPFQLLYHFVVLARNALYDGGLLRATSVAAPVVSVGNLTVGGTGKTPMVIHLANLAAAAGRKVAVVVRDYGAVADDQGRTDEAVLIASRCPDVKLVVAPDKLAGAQRAVAAGANFVIVDDGMQHRRLHRDFEIVMLDARAPYGNGSVLPTGSLREPAAGLGRADLAVLTHYDELSEGERETVLADVRAFRLDLPIVWASHRPIAVRSVAGGIGAQPQSLAGREVFLFCGVASPAGFRATVESLGARVTGMLSFPDHHEITSGDLAAVRARARSAQLLCTEKDAAKVARIPGNEDILCLAIEMELHGALPPIPGLDAPWTPVAPADEAIGHGAALSMHADHGVADHDPARGEGIDHGSASAHSHDDAEAEGHGKAGHGGHGH